MKNIFFKVITIIALFEFISGAILIEGGCFGLGILAMVMPLAWFGIGLLKYGR